MAAMVWQKNSLLQNWLSELSLLDKRVSELVSVYAFCNANRHLAFKPRELTSARIRHYSDTQFRRATVHGAAMLQYEGTHAAM